MKDGSKAPHRVHNKTSAEIEARILELRDKTRYGPVRLKEELEELDGLMISEYTIRNILRRNKAKLKPKPHKPHKKGSRPYVDWYQAKAFEIVQIDLKYVIDQKALSLEQIRHFHSKQFPLYQWSAVDVNSRFKLMAYSDQKSWTNGLTFFLWVLSWLRSHGVSVPIVFTVDRGEEFGGKSWLKLIELRKLLSGFGCSIIQNHAASPQENAHVERSHRTDDEEFYIPRLLSIPYKKDFFLEAMNYLYYYNVVRKHSSLQRRSPWEHLVTVSPDLDAKIRFVPPILLDNIAVQLGDWSGYYLLASHHSQSTGSANLIGESKEALAMVNSTDPSVTYVEEGKFYGSKEDGTLRVLYQPYITHPLIHFDPNSTKDVIEFFTYTLDLETDLTPSNQTFMLKEIFNLVAAIGLLILVIPLSSFILETVEKQAPNPSTDPTFMV